jgi:hypothetical protein
VDLVAGALEDVEGRLVLVAVAAVAAVPVDLDEVHLQGLGEELLVARPDPPERAGLLVAAGVGDRIAVVDDDGLVAYPGMVELLPAEPLQLVLVGFEPAQEHPSVLAHEGSSHRRHHWSTGHTNWCQGVRPSVV